MAKKSPSYLEASYLEQSEQELRDKALSCYQRQRELRDLRKDDPQIAEHQEYVKDMYTTPNADIEAEIKVLRRVFRLKGITFEINESATDTFKKLAKQITDPALNGGFTVTMESNLDKGVLDDHTRRY